MFSFTADEIAQIVQGEVIGDASITITGFAPVDRASKGDLTFADNADYLTKAEQSAASAILTPNLIRTSQKVTIRVGNARVAMARLLPLFFPQPAPSAGIDPSAVVHPSAQIDESVHIGPHCFVAAGARIGPRSAFLGGNYIGRDSTLGEDVVFFPNVVAYHNTSIGNRVSIHAGSVIGSDGYGYVLDEGKHRKVLQVGNVVIEDDVEIGANCAVDRGALGATRIGRGTKIDNLVHVAHNVNIGRNCLVMGQVGFAGSTQIGDYTIIASQSGIAGHLKIGTKSIIGAKSGVMRDVPDGTMVLGIPAMPDKQTKRQWVATQQLPELLQRVRQLEEEIADLKKNLAPGSLP